MSQLGHSLPMRSAPVSHHVGNGLKADVTGKWRNAKTVTISRALWGASVPMFFCRPNAPRPEPIMSQTPSQPVNNAAHMRCFPEPLTYSSASSKKESTSSP
jgi:hypothetical protein